MDERSKCSKFELGLKPKLKTMLRHQEISDFATLVNKCRMVEDDMKADEVMAPKLLPPKHSGPQRNFSHEKGKSKVFQEERKPYSRSTGTRGYTSHGPRTHANARGSRFYQSWDPRLSERFSFGRERFTWEGEILGHTGEFSPERELSRLGEKWHFGAFDTGENFKEKRERRAFQEQGALGLILELEKREILRLEVVSVEFEKLPRAEPQYSPSNTLAQVMKQYFGSSYEAILWLKLCSNTLAQVMKQYFGSSNVAMLWLKLCSNTLAQVMKQYFGSSYVAMLWLKLCSNTLAQVM
ncbi:hypothetical protein Lal_00022865 [Lupinus albus]|nr:hypothetical protein Lal_00022865 [Lupinus albus]